MSHERLKRGEVVRVSMPSTYELDDGRLLEMPQGSVVKIVTNAELAPVTDGSQKSEREFVWAEYKGETFRTSSDWFSRMDS